jgi:hypothetical protein
MVILYLFIVVHVSLRLLTVVSSLSGEHSVKPPLIDLTASLSSMQVLNKGLLPLLDKWHGLQDVEKTLPPALLDHRQP